MTHAEWRACYDDSWSGIIDDESFAHPAKFSYGLISRIYRHCMEMGYIRTGDVVGDPFGGVGLGGIIASYNGIPWIGVELEPRFVELANRNFALHASGWQVLGAPMPLMLQGDSRQFAELVQQCDTIVTSPPFCGSVGSSDRQLEVGKLLIIHGGDGKGGTLRSPARAGGYGKSAGQIGALKPGNLNAIVTSPPYESSRVAGGSQINRDNISQKKDLTAGIKAAWCKNYTQIKGQIGCTKRETYWDAMHEVYGQCRLALNPGGVMCVVIKDYVSKGKRVPLCDQTMSLLQHCRFVAMDRIRAMLVKEDRAPGLFEEENVITKSRKSFFRRLAEKKGSPRIDWEEVLIVRSP